MKFTFTKDKKAYTSYACGIVIATSYMVYRMPSMNSIWAIVVLFVIGSFIFMELKRFQQFVEFDFDNNAFQSKSYIPGIHHNCPIDELYSVKFEKTFSQESPKSVKIVIKIKEESQPIWIEATEEKDINQCDELSMLINRDQSTG